MCPSCPGPPTAPRVWSPSSGGLYVPMRLAETFAGRASVASFVSLVIRHGADVTRFRFGRHPTFNEQSPPLQFQNSFELEPELNDSASADNLRMQAYAATGTSLLAALFIIFTTLSMGVSERSRQLAILRAIARARRWRP
jgi:putative ABC transport system permease protein